jgi:hypothetical protein
MRGEEGKSKPVKNLFSAHTWNIWQNTAHSYLMCTLRKNVVIKKHAYLNWNITLRFEKSSVLIKICPYK